MRCKNCNSELSKEWNFCPYCGKRIRKSLLDAIDTLMRSFLGVPQKRKYRVKIMTASSNSKQLKLPEETIEPESEILRKGNVLIIKLKLPGVNSFDNIRINKMSESLEVYAVGDKGYFKIIQVPEGSTILRKSLSDNTLTIEVSI